MRFRPISVLAIWTSFLIPWLIRPPASGGRISHPTARQAVSIVIKPGLEGPPHAVPDHGHLGRHNGPKQKCLGPPVFKVPALATGTDLAALRPRKSLELDLGADLLEGRLDLLGLVLGHAFLHRLRRTL